MQSTSCDSIDVKEFLYEYWLLRNWHNDDRFYWQRYCIHLVYFCCCWTQTFTSRAYATFAIFFLFRSLSFLIVFERPSPRNWVNEIYRRKNEFFRFQENEENKNSARNLITFWKWNEKKKKLCKQFRWIGVLCSWPIWNSRKVSFKQFLITVLNAPDH